MEDQLKECEDQTRCQCGYRPHVTMGWKYNGNYED